MRKKIEELNNEVFRYYTPDIIVSEDRIEGVVRPNKLFTSSIEITTSDSSVINGTVYSENDIVSIKNGKFEGIRNEIQFELFVDSSISSNHIDGNIIIISDCGEKKVPYYFEISKEGYDTPIGVVKDLFQFTDLAMEYPNKALEIFCTDSFKRIFLSGNRYGTIYDGLIKNSNAMVAMEEFLVEINKKKKINLLVEEKEKVYYVGKENVKDELIIKKSSWGYCKYKVNSDRDYIIKNQIGSGSFGIIFQVYNIMEPYYYPCYHLMGLHLYLYLHFGLSLIIVLLFLLINRNYNLN